MPLPALAIGALVGAALGAGKHFLVDNPREAEERKLAAQIARDSWITGKSTPAITRSNLFGSVLQGGTTGAMVGGAWGKLAGAGGPALSAAQKAQADATGLALLDSAKDVQIPQVSAYNAGGLYNPWNFKTPGTVIDFNATTKNPFA